MSGGGRRKERAKFASSSSNVKTTTKTMIARAAAHRDARLRAVMRTRASGSRATSTRSRRRRHHHRSYRPIRACRPTTRGQRTRGPAASEQRQRQVARRARPRACRSNYTREIGRVALRRSANSDDEQRTLKRVRANKKSRVRRLNVSGAQLFNLARPPPLFVSRLTHLRTRRCSRSHWHDRFAHEALIGKRKLVQSCV